MESSRSILYIEDNPANFRLAERILRDEGFQVLHARDGFEGVKRAIEERERLDLILMDINLPGMDGLAVRARPFFRSIPRRLVFQPTQPKAARRYGARKTSEWYEIYQSCTS